MILKSRFLPFLALVVLAIGAQAQDRSNCSNASLPGSYGLHATGSVIGVGDFAAVGRFTFDGNGSHRKAFRKSRRKQRRASRLHRNLFG
jgi:hypothetical protein